MRGLVRNVPFERNVYIGVAPSGQRVKTVYLVKYGKCVK